MNIRNILHSGDVVRFHNHVGIEKQKNSEHQWGVALIVQHIHPECSKALLLAGLTHDAAEYYVGDIPANVKWDNSELKSMLRKIEKQWEADNGVDFNLSWEESITLKCADTLEGMWYCVHQVRNGNINAKRPFRKWRTFLTELVAEHGKNPGDTLNEILYRVNFLSNKIIQEMEEL